MSKEMISVQENFILLEDQANVLLSFQKQPSEVFCKKRRQPATLFKKSL